MRFILRMDRNVIQKGLETIQRDLDLNASEFEGGSSSSKPHLFIPISGCNLHHPTTIPGILNRF